MLQVPLQSAMSGDDLLFDLEEEPEEGEEEEGSSHPTSSPTSPQWGVFGRGQSTPSEPCTPNMQCAESSSQTCFQPVAQAPALARSHTSGLHHRAAAHFKKRRYR